MKYFFFALFTLSLFLLADCQNNPTPAGASDYTAVSVPAITPAADPNKLREQIMTDYLSANKESKNSAPAYEASFNVIKTMKMHWGSQGDKEKAHIEQLVKDAMNFRLLFEVHQQRISQLDSLNTSISEGNVSLDEAQKKYVAIRTELLTAQGKMPAAQEKVQVVKTEFERDFPGAIKQWFNQVEQHNKLLKPRRF